MAWLSLATNPHQYHKETAGRKQKELAQEAHKFSKERQTFNQEIHWDEPL